MHITSKNSKERQDAYLFVRYGYVTPSNIRDFFYPPPETREVMRQTLELFMEPKGPIEPYMPDHGGDTQRLTGLDGTDGPA